MAEESFEAYHVPQQSRRDKLRVIAQNEPSLLESSTNLSGCSNLLPLYDSSLIPSDFLSCANNLHKENPGFGLKEEGSNLMGFSSSSSSSSSVSHFLDPESSLPLNPGTIQVFNNNPFLYSTQNLREFDQSYNNGGEMMVFKPEPLSLSLSSHQTNLQRYGSAIYGDNKVSGGCVNVPGCLVGNEVSRNSVVPLGPFTGYASILKGSRFLKPAQQLLEELCGVGVRGVFAEKMTPDLSLMEPPNSETLRESGIAEDPIGCGEDGGEGRRKKSRLLTMLDEVYKRYRQYYQQMHAVVTSFEFVSGLGNAAPYASLAVKAMSKHFRCLKNAITDQLQFTNKSHFHISGRKDEASRLDNNDRGPYGQKLVHNPGFLDHHQPVWRPQRGLPERAVTVLRAWLFEHFLHPYPTDTDKLMLAKQTGLSRSQVSNWFINARVRLWKPMVEEIHMLETRQAQKSSQRDENNRNRPNDHLPLDNTLTSENPSSSADKFQDVPYKRTRNELPDLPADRSQEQLNLPYTSNNQPVGVGGSMAAGASNGVSLTLGLHQNHGIVLSEPFPISAAQRLGLALEPNNESYVMGGFETQNRPFGRDVIGGQLLHDFVG